jgi:DNA ligase-4
MAFKFRWFCDLLQKLEQNRVSKASAASRTVNPDNQVVVTWFNMHNAQIPRHGDGAVAFLSCLFPERRPDRVYSLQRKRLASTFGRSLGLGTGRMKELNSWQGRDGSDFPQCVEAVMAQAEFDEPGPGQELTLGELDQALDELAARSPFSSSTIRTDRDPREANAILCSLLRRLQSWEAKWLVRIILKNFSPVIVPEHLAMDQFHFLLRELLDLQRSFEAAVMVLSRPRISQLPPRPAKDCQAALKLGITDELVPHVGVMVKRPSYGKARSIKHCCQMAANRQMSLERKYDGEYC